MKVRFLKDVMGEGGIDSQTGDQLPDVLRMTKKNGRHIPWTAGAIVEMSETSGRKYIDQGVAELVEDEPMMNAVDPDNVEPIYSGQLARGGAFDVLPIDPRKGRLVVKDKDGKELGGHDVDVTKGPTDVKRWTAAAQHIERTA